ncbi:nucleoside triphosphate pyrophosphatase [Kamptonema sp. UHCC 0994]|uniref:Maf family protein n=1 Tax=Kamptonema sp. UHCC 0994 TaxID=3031329 RepID=UPI0023B989F0|nr:nucleoside triphosphate pyrophosphatase [Kamptonema sp. UHCC 0994]MDF0553265.1 Maf family protein [Kamptonema sp. UHCC 0994]
MDIPTFVLASASPARRRLLESAGINPIIYPSDFDESQIQLSDAAELVQILSQRKAETVAKYLIANPNSLPTGKKPEFEQGKSIVVLGCDSLLVVGDEIHGKPADAKDAIARWQKMRGEVGQLYTGHTLIDLTQDRIKVKCQVTQVYFAEVSDRQIAAYVATGEPLQCAGCFAIEGKGGLFIEKIEGCHTNVIGLSLPLLRIMLAELGYDVTDFWQSN